jgi:cystathionine gamma-synthase
MARHPKITRVYYPGLPDFPAHALAKAQMHGFGGMVSLEVAGTGADATRVADRLRLFALAPSPYKCRFFRGGKKRVNET